MKWGWTKMMFGKADTFGLCYDDPDVTSADKLRYEACMVVDAKTKPKGDIEVKDLPPCAYAVGLHEGPLAELSGAYAQLFARVASGPIEGIVRFRGSSWEGFRDRCWHEEGFSLTMSA